MDDTVKRASGTRPKKRKFSGNRFTIAAEKATSKASASSKKLKLSAFDDSGMDSTFLGYRLIDINILFTEITNCLCCKICGGAVKMEECCIYGLSSKFNFSCKNCNELTSFRNSKMIGNKNNVSEINKRFIYAMRCVGQGRAGLKTFCSVMDLPPPVHASSYAKILRKISLDISRCADISMRKAAEDEVNFTGDSKLSISGDGSWKTRGHSSQIGLTSVIGAETGKVIDIEVMSTFCKGCDEGKKLSGTPEYEEWQNEHKNVCIRNHSGTAGKMEVDGMLRIFQRSESKYNVQYVNYIGDGDTKTFLELQKNNPYGPDHTLSKVECVGHIQKRMGNRLRQLKQKMRGKKLEDGKPLSGKNRLTDKLIDQITVYYGNAIRSNKNDCMGMRKAVWAIYYHKRSTDDEPLHDFCPSGKNTWCPYNKAKMVGKEKDFQHQHILPAAVMDCVKPIFKDLSDPNLLRRCLGGRTQNSNESFNSLVWKLCPKTSGASRIVADIASNEAVISFNDGKRGRLHIMKTMSFQVGNFALDAVTKADNLRIKEADKEALEMTLESRRARRLNKIVHLQQLKAKEGTTYEAGKF